MTYTYAERLNNIYLIDTHMFGFPKFNAAYIVKGKEVALIDTGTPPSLDIVRAAIKKHGFSVQDLSYIFVTHCEHPDHSGNVGALLRENPKLKVYINPIGKLPLTNPEIDAAKRKAILSERMAKRFGDMVPVDKSRIYDLKDGEQFDLGDGEKLKVIFAPGHQPGGMVIYEEKNKGLFINDLCGLYLSDANASWIFTPFDSDILKARESLNMLSKLPLSQLYLGHFGICDKPQEVIKGALHKIQSLFDLGDSCVKEGKEKEIAPRLIKILMPEVEKIRAVRDQDIYEYLSQELIPSLAANFAKYYLSIPKK
jgi:glyoxylase-like metal-dependent hydrolase (beta-lactamase superfamily II)